MSKLDPGKDPSADNAGAVVAQADTAQADIAEADTAQMDDAQAESTPADDGQGGDRQGESTQGDDVQAEAGAAEEDSAVEEKGTGGGRGRFAGVTLPSLPKLGRGGRVAVRAGAAVVVGAAVASSVFFFLQNSDKQDLLDARQAAQSAACAYAPVLATYDAKNLDAYFAGVLDGATGDWRRQFDSTSKDLREVLTQGQVVSKATDVQCAVRTGDKDSAEAIVVIGQTITSLGTQNKPAPGQLSMVMRLERHGDRWLVNKVNSPLAQQSQP